MFSNYNMRKINLATAYHVIVVHSIAQTAIICNGLFGRCVRMMTGRFKFSCAVGMTVCINHILPCNKAKEQQPGFGEMVFIVFHSCRKNREILL